MQAGQALQGSLSECRKLKNKKMGIRIVFREANGKIEVIQIVAIGKRDNKGLELPPPTLSLRGGGFLGTSLYRAIID